MVLTADNFEILHEPLAAMMEEFNATSVQIEYDLAYDGLECSSDGELIQVCTPWAMGLVDKQGVSLV